MSTADVVVIGGGVAGLAAARALAPSRSVVLLEAAASPGGKMVSAPLDGRPVDLGPDSFITRYASGLTTCEELGLTEHLIAPSSNSAALFARGALRPLPKGIVLGVPTDPHALRAAGVVGRGAVVRATLDRRRRRAVLPADAMERARNGTEDPSVAAVFGPRLGNEVVRTLIDPLLGGINASDVSYLSLAACAPQLLARLAGRPSVLRALSELPPTFSEGAPKPPFLGLSGGMGELAQALERACAAAGVELRCSAPARSIIKLDNGRWRVRADDDEIESAAVVLAVPAFVAAELLGPIEPDLAAELSAIPYASVISAYFAWPDEAVPLAIRRRLAEIVPAPPSGAAPVLPGSGVLVPRDGTRLMTAATFTSTKWPRSAAEGQVVIRTFAGRHADERALALDDAALVRGLRADLEAILGITTEPTTSLLHRWERGLPQFVTGHLARLGRIDAALASLPTLALAGAAYKGVGIPACIDTALAAAERIRSAA